MAETFPTDAALLAKMASTDTASGVVYPTSYDDPHLVAWAKAHWQFIGRSVSAMQVYKDGALTFGVRAGKFHDGDTERTFAAVAAQALTDDDTNYIFLTAAGTLTVNVTGFPATGTTPHIPLATIVCADGDYDADPAAGELTDYRFSALFNIIAADTAANRNTLVGGSNADALHIHAAAGLAAALQDLVPYLALAGTDDADGTGSMDIQVKDAAGNNLEQRFLIRTWIADAEYSEPDAQTDFSVTYGEMLREIEADADYEVLTDSVGAVTMNIDTAADKTVYVMAEIDGRIYTGSVAITGNP